ncbi:hypothetical protein N186_03735 [Thermofilum adornatum]|uniref:Uncharacterized protein n=1 Tax=Thermofilum adornatum TaxID=1365176 RepID=S5ZVF7_9CREN|nr:hypothetical protein N186_03735 [Thermofilum adornatum]
MFMKFLDGKVILKRDYGKTSRPKTGYFEKLPNWEVSEASNV